MGRNVINPIIMLKYSFYLYDPDKLNFWLRHVSVRDIMLKSTVEEFLRVLKSLKTGPKGRAQKESLKKRPKERA